MFYQPDKPTFANVVLKLFEGTEDLLKQYLKAENISNDSVGYRPDTKLVVLSPSVTLLGDFYSRDRDPEKYP